MTDGLIRIAYCLDNFRIGGTERHAIRAAERLDPAVFELHVFCLSEDGPLRARYEALGVPISHIQIPNLYSLQTAREGIRLASLIRSARIDIMHSHDIYSNIFAVPWTRVLSSARVIASRRWGRGVFGRGMSRVNRIAMHFAHRVVGNSPSTVGLVRDIDHISSRKAVLIPNFLDENAFALPSDLDCRDARRRWGVPEDAFVIGIVARLSPVKNHQLVFQAMQRMDRSCRLVIIGDGPSRAELVAAAEALAISDRTHFVGEILAEDNLHRCFDVSVLCSHSEGFPNSLIEAMAVARPVVATAVGGVVDAIQDGVNGILIRPNSVDEMVAALIKLKGDRKLREAIGVAAREFARKNYHEDVVMCQLRDQYQQLAQSGSH